MLEFDEPDEEADQYDEGLFAVVPPDLLGGTPPKVSVGDNLAIDDCDEEAF